jgi:hypothetical protein
MSALEEDAASKAAELGLEIITPKPNELFLDIDDAESLTLFHEMLPILKQMYAVETVFIKPSKSGGEKKHVTVVLGDGVSSPELTTEQRILLQAVLGSDRKRELLSYKRLVTGARPDEYVTVFFELPKESEDLSETLMSELPSQKEMRLEQAA